MTGFKTRDFERAIAREQERTDEIRASQPLIDPVEIRPLTEQVKEPGPLDRLLNRFVTGHPQPAGDETQATPASRRHSPERAAGRRGAGDGQRRLRVVEPMGQLIDATGRFDARRRDHFNNGSAA